MGAAEDNDVVVVGLHGKQGPVEGKTGIAHFHSAPAKTRVADSQELNAADRLTPVDAAEDEANLEVEDAARMSVPRLLHAREQGPPVFAAIVELAARGGIIVSRPCDDKAPAIDCAQRCALDRQLGKRPLFMSHPVLEDALYDLELEAAASAGTTASDHEKVV